MKQCLIYDASLRFSKGFFGILILIAFLFQNHWLILITSFLNFFGIFSINFNIPYQFHVLILKKLFKKKIKLTQKELGELIFVSIMGGIILFISFLLLYFKKFITFAWILILIMSLLMFLSYFIGICAAASMYVFLKKILSFIRKH